MTTPNPPEYDPRSSKLPPADGGSDAAKKSKSIFPSEGVSPKLKVFVIGLTFLTLMAFGLFAAQLVKKVFIKTPDEGEWSQQWLTIADELKQKGFKSQAIDHYQKYLEEGKPDSSTRSRVALEISKLYVALGKCRDATAWVLHARTAQKSSPDLKEAEAAVQQCREQTHPSP